MSKIIPTLPIKFLGATRIARDDGTVVISLPTCTVPENVELVPVEIPSTARIVDLDSVLAEWFETQTLEDRDPVTDRAK